MFSSFAKLFAAVTSVAAPFICGWLASGVPEIAGRGLIGVIGIGLGLAALAVFCSLDTAEEIAHQRRLQGDRRLAGREG